MRLWVGYAFMGKGPFLMYRVELKELLLAEALVACKALFLMYRVELKVFGQELFALKKLKLVPNVPCGVERQGLDTIYSTLLRSS